MTPWPLHPDLVAEAERLLIAGCAARDVTRRLPVSIRAAQALRKRLVAEGRMHAHRNRPDGWKPPGRRRMAVPVVVDAPTVGLFWQPTRQQLMGGR